MTYWNTCPAVERNRGKVSVARGFTGTRVPVCALFENLAAGATINEFIEWFLDVGERQVRAVFEHGAKAPKTAVARCGCRSIRSIPARLCLIADGGTGKLAARELAAHRRMKATI